MSEWRTTTLGEFIALQRGHDLPQRERRPGSVPVVGSGGITGWHDAAIAPGPGITIGRAANLGVPTFVERDFWPLNTTLYVTDFRGNDIRFTYYLLQTLDLTGFNSGSVQPMLNRNYIKNVPLRVPALSEQRAIASVLGALDDKIALNDRISVTYESLLRVEFARLRVDDEPPLGGGGECVAVSDLVEVNPATPQPSRDREAAYVDMAALSTDTARIRGWMRRLPRAGARFVNGDALLARITPCLENGKAGYVDFLDDGEVGTGSTEFIVLRSRPGVPSHFAYFLTRSPRFREHAIRNMAGSSGRQRVSAGVLANFQLRKPDNAELAAFGDSAARAFALMKSLDEEVRYLRDLRDQLLPRLLAGEIRVREAEKTVETAT